VRPSAADAAGKKPSKGTEIKHHYCTALPIGTESAEVKDVGVIDSFHPTKAGYAKWWMPKLETELKTLLEQ
jgi:hypothetical protein